MICYFADAMIKRDLQFIRLGPTPLERCGDKGLAEGNNSCADLIAATPEIEPLTFRIPIMYRSF